MSAPSILASSDSIYPVIGSGTDGVICADYQKGRAIKFLDCVEEGCTPSEILIHKCLNHLNIVSFLDGYVRKSVSQEGFRPVLVTELMDANLHYFINSKYYDAKYVKLFMYQLLKGLEYLKSMELVHTDIKPSNLLLKRNTLKIADFGQSMYVTNEGIENTSEFTTRWYRAPELLVQMEHYSAAIDIWYSFI